MYLGRGRIASLAAVEEASNAVYVPAQSATTYHSYAVTLYMLPVRMLWIFTYSRLYLLMFSVHPCDSSSKNLTV